MFYGQVVRYIEPGWTSGDFGGRTETWDPDEGAKVTKVPFGVDVQPWVSTEVLEDGTRVAKTIGLQLHTPPGRDLVLPDRVRIDYRGELWRVAGTKRWPSDQWPSGVDHVVVSLERREG